MLDGEHLFQRFFPPFTLGEKAGRTLKFFIWYLIYIYMYIVHDFMYMIKHLQLCMYIIYILCCIVVYTFMILCINLCPLHIVVKYRSVYQTTIVFRSAGGSSAIVRDVTLDSSGDPRIQRWVRGTMPHWFCQLAGFTWIHCFNQSSPCKMYNEYTWNYLADFTWIHCFNQSSPCNMYKSLKFEIYMIPCCKAQISSIGRQRFD